MKERKELIKMLSLERKGKGCNNDDLIELFDKAVQHAREEQLKEFREIIEDLAYQKKGKKIVRVDINHLNIIKRLTK